MKASFSFFKNCPQSRVGVVGVLLLLFCPACTLLGSMGDITALSQHAEDVFHHQNTVIEQIMRVSEDLDDSNYQILSQAELQMYDQCRFLNDYAIKERDGLAQDFSSKRKILNSVNDCENSIQGVEALLSHYAP